MERTFSMDDLVGNMMWKQMGMGMGRTSSEAELAQFLNTVGSLDGLSSLVGPGPTPDTPTGAQGMGMRRRESETGNPKIIHQRRSVTPFGRPIPFPSPRAPG